jgi:putative ABC transport system permease protein
MGQWLESFAYRIDLSIGIFLVAGGIVILVAFLTISYDAIKTALMNPIQSLRSE